MMDMTNILEALVALAAAVITAVIIPYIKSRTTTNQQSQLNEWMKIAVLAAEQIYNGPGKGAEKKDYVLDFIQKKGIRLEASAVDALMEATVLSLNKGLF